jgi:uncharacterized protein YrzB (UPF0473 family)
VSKDNEIEMNEDYTPDLYELEDENGDKQSFELLDVMEFEGEKYYALTPYYDEQELDKMLDDCGEVVILKSEFDENNDEILASIDDDDEYERIGDMFMKRIEEMFEYDDDEECGCGDADCDGKHFS